MRSVSIDFFDLLDRDETEFTFIAAITKRNGEVIRLSACVGDVVSGSDIYYGDPGFSLTTITSAAFGQPPQVEMQIPVSPDGLVSSDDVTFGALDSATVDLYMIDYKRPDDGWMALLRGKISTASINEIGAASFQIEGFASDLMELVVETYGVTCPASLGDSRCQKDLTAFTFAATVSSVTSRSAFALTISAPDAVDGWFANGAVKFTSGLNSGFAFDIRNWDQGDARVDLWLSAIADIEVGDTVLIVAGCDKLPETCRIKFDNMINYQGFPFLPTSSDMQCDDDGNELSDRPAVGTVVKIEC